MIKYRLDASAVTLASQRQFYIGWPHARGPSFGGDMLSGLSTLIAILHR